MVFNVWFVGLAFLTPLLIWIAGDVELALGVHCHWWYRHYLVADLVLRFISRAYDIVGKAELDYIRDGGGLVDGDAPVKARQPLATKDWKLVMFHIKADRRLGQFAVASTLWFS